MKAKTLRTCALGLLSLAVSLTSLAAVSAERNPLIKSFMFRDAPIEYAMSMLGETWGRHIVVNDSAKETLVRTFLRDIDCLGALKAICHGHGLWYREDPDSGIIYVLTLEEFVKGGAHSEKKFVEVVTLVYPRCEDIASAIQEAYRDMVIYYPPDQDDDDEIGDISRALERMDELADRSTIVEGDGSSSGSGSRSSGGRGRSSSRRGQQSQQGMENVRRYYDDIGRIGDKNAQIQFVPEKGDGAGGSSPKELRPSMVFASIVRRSNSIVLRSSDREMIGQIKDTIRQLDVPRAQVLLEVRVLQLDISDEKDRELGFMLNGDSHTYGSAAGGFSKNMTVSDARYKVTGSHTADGKTYTLDDNTYYSDFSVPQIVESAFYPNHSVFQVLNKHYKIRLNMLDSKGKVRALATPSLMVADYEASRIFLGVTRYIQTGFSPGSTVLTDGGGTSTDTTANFEERNIGTALVITPKVHTDGTVTLRIMQENSTAEPINPVETATGTFYEQPIKKETITSSIIAKDGETIALGGLMEHKETESLYKIPFLGDLPYIGAFFRHAAKNKSEYELVVLIRPTVVLAPSGGQAASRNFLRENMQDKRGLHEVMDKTRVQRREISDRKLSETESSNTNTIVNAEASIDWMPR